MSIQYAGGTIVNTTVAADTRGLFASNLKDQLVAAGWTLVRTNTTNDFVLDTATTPQGLKMRMRVVDPGSGTCMKLIGMTPTENKVSASFAGQQFMLPGAGKVYRLIANKYQFFLFTVGASAAREFAAGGVPWIPAWLNGVITECHWLQGNGNSDSTTSAVDTLRNRLYCLGSLFANINNNVLDSASFSGGAVGHWRMIVPGNVYPGTSGAGFRWHDDTVLVSEPLVAWGATSTNDEAKIRGQLWDCFVSSDNWLPDTSISYDGRTYYSVTGNNTYGTSNLGGTMFVAVT